MEQIILIVHLLVALAIIGLIMLQQGKGADMGASFGAGASQTLFGSDGSGNVLTKATAWLVALFFATSFGLALLASQKSVVVDDIGLEIPPEVMETQAPAAVEEEFPVLEEEIPAAEPVEEDLPQLD
jgi:preprotein translocase subunit SecG